jgi:RNA polymerase sigma-70 factor (ECF subfamily)
VSVDIDACRAAWPGVLLEEARFSAWLDDRPTATAANHPDLYLAAACAHNVDGAIAAFDQAYMRRVDDFLTRQRLPPGGLDDIKQQLRERLFVAGRIREYSGQGPLANWLRVVSVRAAVDLGRKRSEALLDESGPVAVAASDHPELDYLKETYRSAVARAFKGSLTELPSEQRNILHLHFVDGMTLDELAALFHVHRATIARRIAAAREAVLDEARRLFSREANVAPAEVDSLFALVRSQLDLTLSSLM